MNSFANGRSRAPLTARGSRRRAGILLDRDGTIIVDHGYVGSVDRVEFIEGAPEAIAQFNQARIPVAVVTNQAGVARGLYGIDDVERVHHYITERLAKCGARIDLFLYCPYHPAGVVEAFARVSEDRKPRPGMANAAAAALDLDLARSWVVGDQPEDIGLAEAVGAPAIYLGSGGEHPGVPSFPSLSAAASFLLERIAVAPSAGDLRDLSSWAGDGAAKFPATRFRDAASYLGGYVEETVWAASSIEKAAFDRAAAILLGAYTRGATVFSCGNGGSAAIANHLQCDHTKGVRAATDLMPRVVSLSASIELVTAIANDISYEDVFVFQLQSQANPGDVLVAVSSSGRSPNIVHALRWARDHGLHTIALTGFDGGEAKALAEVAVHVNGRNYGVVEDLHQVIMHALAQYIRQSHMTTEAISYSIF